jgi:hypothetical protein
MISICSLCLYPFLLFGNIFCLQGSAYDCVLYEKQRRGGAQRDKGLFLCAKGEAR